MTRPETRNPDSPKSIWLQSIALILVAVVGFSAFLLVAQYPMYLDDIGDQQACEDEFGDSAVYAGDVGGIGSGGDSVFCKTDRGVKITEGKNAPMSIETLQQYLGAVGRGDV